MSDNSGYLPLPKGFTTKAIHSSADPDRWDSKCIVPPLVLSTTFKHIEPGKYNVRENFQLNLLDIFLICVPLSIVCIWPGQ